MPPTSPVPVVETTSGRARGIESEDVLLYAGIPYGAPPIGDQRFAAPRPHSGWTGVRECDRFGPSAMQPTEQRYFAGGGVPPRGEECLSLNVQTPAVDGDPRPVVVVLHGGGFQHGAGAVRPNNGARFAGNGDVVVVTPNYRLGAFGWLYLDHLDEEFAGSGNVGLLDQLLALRWVQDNIAAFGGDPDRVTLLGMSAGAMSATTLMTLADARGLFHQVIAQSGTPRFTIRPRHAIEVTGRVLDDLGLTDPHDLRTVDAERLLAAQVAASQAIGLARAVRPNPHWFLTFGPVVDSCVVPKHPLRSFAAGKAAPLPLLLGCNDDEWNWFAHLTPPDEDRALIVDRLGHLGVPDPDAMLDQYLAVTGGDLDAAWIAIRGDRVFRAPAARLADAHRVQQPATFQYLFAWSSPEGGLAACHALEVVFVFDNLHQNDMSFYIGRNPPQELATEMHRAWIAFIHTGSPNGPGLPVWPPYDDDRATMVFDDSPAVEHDPRGERRRLWDGID
jgi:para-nitrobenzyl esterase